ncbi:MAG TPA: hypothetical protein VEH04_07755 [Verrucomicrobiae bacterium]|nr:hypothetical protein [Verrucomicrobiae bacterium]
MNATHSACETTGGVSEVDRLRERLETASFEARFYRGLCWALLAMGAIGTLAHLLNR